MEEINSEIVVIDNFSIKTENSEKFIEELEELCKKYAIDKEYSFKYDVEG